MAEIGESGICAEWGSGVDICDGMLLAYALGQQGILGRRSLVDELRARGYDISTIEFRVKRV
jgi:hypothetical protein